MAHGKRSDNRENGLIDVEILQRFQEHFCKAHRVYLVCIGSEEGVLTEHYGSEEERAYLRQFIGENAYMSLLVRLNNNPVEHMAEEDFPDPFLKMCGVSTSIEGKTQITWCVTAILQDKAGENDEIPDYMMTTTEHSSTGQWSFWSISPSCFLRSSWMS